MNQQTRLRDHFEQAARIVAVPIPPFDQVLARDLAPTRSRRPRRVLAATAAALAVAGVAIVVPRAIGGVNGVHARDAVPQGTADAGWRQAATMRARELGVRVDAVLYAGAISGGSVLIVRSGNAMTPLLAVGSSEPTDLKVASFGSATGRNTLSAWAFSSAKKLQYFVYCPTCDAGNSLSLSAAPNYAPDGSVSRTWSALHLVGGFTAGALALGDITDPAIRVAAAAGGYELDSVPWTPAVDPLQAWYDAATMQAIAKEQSVELTTFNAATLEWAGRIADRLPSATRPSASAIAAICETFASFLDLGPTQLTVTALWAGALPASGSPNGIALLVTIPGGAEFQIAMESGGPMVSAGVSAGDGPSLSTTNGTTSFPNSVGAEPGTADERYGLSGVFARSVPPANAQQLPVPWIDPASPTAAYPTIDVVAPGAAAVRLVRTGSNAVVATSNVGAGGLATFPHSGVARALLQQPGAIVADSLNESGQLIAATPLVGPHANDPFDDARLDGAREVIPPS
jgi:hypothetical protein